MNDARIERIHSTEDPFVRIPHELLNDDSLSWEARGILCYVLSQPAEWEFNEADIICHGPSGPDDVIEALNEIREAGYVL